MNVKEVVKIYNEAYERLNKKLKVVEKSYQLQKQQVFNDFAEELKIKFKDIDFDTMMNIVEGDDLDTKAKALISNIFSTNADNKIDAILSLLITTELLIDLEEGL